MDYEKKALEYHKSEPAGKISVQYTKALDSQEHLSLAYSPGVAGPCREIAERPDDSFVYTTRGNLVAVISNGTAVLGLGNIGPYASKPVMEGKGMLFKRFADIDVFDLEVDATDPDEFIRVVKALEPTFGGVNLEDIKAPECFYIEEKLREEMAIPVFHDDQHGTAIITAAAFLNALELSGRNISQCKVVFSGAGAAAISCASLLINLGVSAKNLIMVDSRGVIHPGREDLNPYKQRFVNDTQARSLADALDGADAFVGVSQPDVLTAEMLKSMAKDPIVFALSNPNPEINPQLAQETRSDVIMATGRSDYPNQVNNVLGFPYIFRGALDVRATTINEAMKHAAVRAIADLAKEEVPEEVLQVYNKKAGTYSFGRDYLIPKPVDQRVLLRVAPAVAKAAMESGVARLNISMADYQERIERLLGPTKRIIRSVRKDIARTIHDTRRKPRVTLTAGADTRIIQAARQVATSGEVSIFLLGERAKIEAKAAEIGIADLDQDIEIIDPITTPERSAYAECLYQLRKRRGVSRTLADQLIKDEHHFGATMLHQGHTDALVAGIDVAYRTAVKPILRIVGPLPDRVLAGVYMMVKDQSVTFFADCTINVDPSAAELADIALAAAETASHYTNDPIRVAMLSYASFGTSTHPSSRKVAQAVEILKDAAPHLEVDGEMQVDVALDATLRQEEFPFCSLKGNANVLIFPDLAAANIAYKLMSKMGGATPTGPLLVGLAKPACVLQRGASVEEAANMIILCAHQALEYQRA